MLHRNNLPKTLEQGNIVYSRDISKDIDWQDTLSKGGRLLMILGIKDSNVLFIIKEMTPKGLKEIKKYKASRERLKKFIEKEFHVQ